ncbi:MAG: hypothetical protein AAF628_23250 [Planctomycetota bacterium]
MMSPRRSRALLLLILIATPALVVAHGQYTKPLFNAEVLIRTTGAPPVEWINSKANASTRGSAGGDATTLYMMDPPLNHTGFTDVLGWRFFAQDEDPSTLEWMEFKSVALLPGTTAPDTSPAGELLTLRFPLLFPAGVKAREWNVVRIPTMPGPLDAVHHGVALELPEAPNWPNDGLSIHAQLNLPGDPLRLRVQAPFDQEVYAYERLDGSSTPTPLGGRTLDTLLLTHEYATDAVLQTFVMSNAYGAGPEMLFGPESLHPDSTRGDALGFFLQSAGNSEGVPGIAMLVLGPRLAPTPMRWPGIGGNNFIYLDPAACLLLQAGNPTAAGEFTFPAIPFHAFPPALRSFWVQGVIAYPGSTEPVRVTDAVGVQGT